MICKFCRWGHTAHEIVSKEDGFIYPAKTWCASNKFELRPGFNSFPDLFECTDFEIDPSLTLEDVGVTVLAQSQKEFNRLNALLNRQLYDNHN
jgi:hypothetical protein